MATKHIFIVEDDEFFAKVFTKRIEKIGDFTVHHFVSCEVALENLLKFKPAAIFLDHYLTGLNGVDALPLFKKNLPETKVVIISGQNDKAILEKAMDSGATNYFRKDVLIMHNTEDFLERFNEEDSAIKKFFNGLFGS